jgi:glutamine synthetase
MRLKQALEAGQSAAAPRGSQVLPARAYLDAHPETRAIDLLISDMNGIVRGKRIGPDELDKVLKDGLRLVGSVFALDVHGDNVEAAGLAVDTGDKDQKAIAVDGLLMPVPWAPTPTAQMLMTMVDEATGEPFFADPRQILKSVVARFAELKLKPVVACELEFYLIDQARDAAGGPQPPISPVTGLREWSTQVLSMQDLDVYGAVLDGTVAACAAQGLPATSALSEYAPGQFEINLNHTDDPVAAGDHAVLFKRAVRGVARANGLDATFMAKPYRDLSGSGLHIHASLVDETGRNVFAGGTGSDIVPTEIMRNAIGGLIAALPESMAILAPNANSYRRFRRGSYAPCTPTWGIENRTVALRVPGGDAKATRIEHRVGGADANPYLVLAAMLAAMHHGIVNRIDPGAPLVGNAHTLAKASLPRRWSEALDAFDQGTVLKPYLGEAYHRVYGCCRRAELDRFEGEITPIEHAWYLPVI